MITLQEGKSYTAKVTLINTSTKAGSPVAATIRVFVAVSPSSIAVVSPAAQEHDFLPSESYDFLFPLTVPAGASGKSGSIAAVAADPNSNQIASATEDISIAVQNPVLSFSIVHPHPASSYLLVWWQIALFDLQMKTLAVIPASGPQTFDKQFIINNPPLDVLMVIRLTDQTLSVFDSPFYRVKFPGYGSYVWDDTAKTMNGINGPAVVTELNYNPCDFIGTIVSTRIGNIPGIPNSSATYATILIESITPDDSRNIFHYMLGNALEFEVNLPHRLQYGYWGSITELLVPDGTRVIGILNPPAPPESSEG